jgi:alpha-tubulin suppressor-like RCC1 family protein
VQVVAGGDHTCALLDTGAVRCWGDNTAGQLGYGNTNDIGDDELPSSVAAVNVGGSVQQLAAGGAHTCALLDTGAVRCWGENSSGQLGYGNTNGIGGSETPASAGNVNVGGTVLHITAGLDHTCALLAGGAVRCWGDNSSGELGYGNTNDIGDNELPSSVATVNVGGTVTTLDAGSNVTCALLTTGAVRCWGFGGIGTLGYGNTNNIGDNETPASAGSVNVGGTVAQITVGGPTCTILEAGTVRCWGSGSNGALGYGNTNNIGDDELPSTAGNVTLR